MSEYQLDIFEGAKAPVLLELVKGQLDRLAVLAWYAVDAPTPMDWFSVRALCTPEARQLSLSDWKAAQDYEEFLHDRLCQMYNGVPEFACGIYTHDEWLCVLEEH